MISASIARIASRPFADRPLLIRNSASTRPELARTRRGRGGRAARRSRRAAARSRAGPRAAAAEPRACASAVRTRDDATSVIGRLAVRLDLEVLLEPGAAVLAADSALLVAAERDLGARVDAAVDDHRAGADLAGDGLRTLAVARVHRARQPVDAVVGHAHRVVVVLVRQRHEHRPEDLVAHDLGVLGHVGEQRRLVVVALCRTAAAAGRR